MLYSNKNGTTNPRRKRKLAPLLEPTFLQVLASHPPSAVSSPKALGLTNDTLQALHDCQETFVAQLTRHLKTASSSNDGREGLDDDTKRTVHVLPRRVQEAMTAMRMQDVWDQASSLQQQPQDEATNGEGKASLSKQRQQQLLQKRKKKMKPMAMTVEMEAEQERLFQASRDRKTS